MIEDSLFNNMRKFEDLLRELTPVDKRRIALRRLLDRIKKDPVIAVKADSRYALYYLVERSRRNSTTSASFIMNLKRKLDEIEGYNAELAGIIRNAQLANQREIEVLSELDGEVNEGIGAIINYIRAHFNDIISRLRVEGE